jgi:hypothetical protein
MNAARWVVVAGKKIRQAWNYETMFADVLAELERA